ncbi:TIGR03767 family metallophosphoesterase [Streptomyces sp. NP160]|uniref:TIGR03767 family metallophosphoesterase n=1 Tax=Streptomyces sp. NP160 TaxID=2586637 RepID=UPI00111AED18|nr:TIGR03767 family metallophosphoesterase [Streptomyces sp. NP160]TNM59964.1 TIGR03767 family metallophosphoesterase [Streptomyces sp. NP160]
MSGDHGHGGLTTGWRLGPGEVVRRGSLRPYRRVAVEPGEPHRVRADLVGISAAESVAQARLRPLLAFAHVTDLQLADVESTARCEFFNREAADPLFAKLVPVQRPQEALAARAMHAMVRTLNRLHADGAPLSGRGLDTVVTTGDAIDNAQWNELRNWLALLGGGAVRPGSGGPTYEGVQAPTWPLLPDDVFWRPDGPPPGGPAGLDDVWTAGYGFPTRPGLLRAALAEFDSEGLAVPWLACYGNHEALTQGVGVVTPELAVLMVSGRKPSRLPPGLARDRALETFTLRAQEFFDARTDVAVVPDPERRPVSRRDFVEAHLAAGGRPDGHGFSARNLGAGPAEASAYYAHDAGPVRFLTLDTTVAAGGADGALDEAQLRWLDRELAGAAHERRWVVVLSHHGSTTLAGGSELVDRLLRSGQVLAWVNGHTHRNAVHAHPDPQRPGGGLWEITTSAVMDWPCQARVLELLDAGEGVLVLACTMLDHDGRVVPATGPLSSTSDLAGLHRELAGNVPGADFASPASGGPLDRNVLLALRAPAPARGT